MKTPIKATEKALRLHVLLIPHGRKGGFTLLEICIVLATLGVLILLGAPQINGLISTYRLNGAARLVLGDLQNAKMTAIQQNRSIQVTFNISSYSFAQVDTGTTFFNRYLSTEYPSISLSNSSGSTLTWTSSGMASISTVTITGSSTPRTITISSTGRILLN
jgi:Tfp pilus assembly protein FimT